MFMGVADVAIIRDGWRCGWQEAGWAPCEVAHKPPSWCTPFYHRSLGGLVVAGTVYLHECAYLNMSIYIYFHFLIVQLAFQQWSLKTIAFYNQCHVWYWICCRRTWLLTKFLDAGIHRSIWREQSTFCYKTDLPVCNGRNSTTCEDPSLIYLHPFMRYLEIMFPFSATSVYA